MKMITNISLSLWFPVIILLKHELDKMSAAVNFNFQVTLQITLIGLQ